MTAKTDTLLMILFKKKKVLTIILPRCFLGSNRPKSSHFNMDRLNVHHHMCMIWIAPEGVSENVLV